MDLKYTPDNITSLGQDEVFVFGSNLEGIHAGGAARLARERFGAVMGQGVGMQGRSYAIPTMQGGVDTIRPYVDDFIDLAREWDQTTFYVTRIGCGIAGFTDEQIAPLFVDALDLYNVRLPKSFVDVLTDGRYARSYSYNWRKRYSSYDTMIDYLLILDRFRHYGPHELSKALADHEDMTGQASRRSLYPMCEIMLDKYPGDSAAGTIEGVKYYLDSLAPVIEHSRPYDAPCMRYIYSMISELANLMLEIKEWGRCDAVSLTPGNMFFYTLYSIITGRWNCGDNSYIYDNTESAYPVFRYVLQRKWNDMFTAGRLDSRKVVEVFSDPVIWKEWEVKAKHDLAVYRCASSFLYHLCLGNDAVYGNDGKGTYFPIEDYSLPVFCSEYGRVRFPDFALKRAFIDRLKSQTEVR